jgi:hypothetical protein
MACDTCVTRHLKSGAPGPASQRYVASARHVRSRAISPQPAGLAPSEGWRARDGQYNYPPSLCIVRHRSSRSLNPLCGPPAGGDWRPVSVSAKGPPPLSRFEQRQPVRECSLQPWRILH